MKCKIKRDIFSLFTVYKCEGCKYKNLDEFHYIGRNVIGIYYIFDNCLDLDIDKERLSFFNEKLKRLMLDAINNQNEIFMCMVDNIKLEDYYEVFDKVIDENLSVQIIVL